MFDTAFHRCFDFDYCMLNDKEYLLFCKECKKASAIVQFKIKDKLRKRYDDKLLEDLK